MKYAADIIIVGGGIGGQVSARALAYAGYQVIVCEAQPKLSGFQSVMTPISIQNIPEPFALNCLQEEHLSTLHLPVDRLMPIQTHGPLLYEKKLWREVAPEELKSEQLLFYFRNFSWPRGGFPTSDFCKHPNIQIHLHEPITDCELSENKIQSVRNSKVCFSGRAFIFALPSDAMFPLLRKNFLEPHFLKQFQKKKAISAVTLDFVLKKKVSQEIEILMSLDPVGVGFSPSNSDPSLCAPEYQILQWMFFLPPDEGKDKEAMAKTMMAGKRFLQRVFPGFEEQCLWQRIGILPQITLQEPLHDSPHAIPLSNAFWVTHEFGQISSAGRPSVLQALKVCGRVQEALKKPL
ncbi:MAG: FAD-binding protein [Deltaproteobacteria bacterium]|nr:FAD-binding protein [Deltaproteobacteria bacterium]